MITNEKEKKLHNEGSNQPNYKKNYNNPSVNMKDYWVSREKKEIFLNMVEEDKEKLIALDSWALRALELTVLERNVKCVPVRGEIWSLDLGINVGDEMDKVRPCIIVSYNIYNDKSNLCSVIPITHADCSHRTQFEINESCLEYSESTISGTAKAEQITTKSKARLGRKIGQLNEKGLKQLNYALLNHLGMESLAQLTELCPDIKPELMEQIQDLINKFTA
ncbi:type II toxin-antitoxin system PemK/MazF family toxin [Clostridium disporicum]|uniref:type II toxin-antitoxin system PemK/MazF family toxin n=1 Tax=Clostridium disporicum TaxID=84024 RepID=UPI0034A407C7